MGIVSRVLVVLAGCGLLSACETLESVGSSLGAMLPAAPPPEQSSPLWVEQPAPAAGGVGAVCRAGSTTCPLDPPLALGAHCTCVAEGIIGIGVAAAAQAED